MLRFRVCPGHCLGYLLYSSQACPCVSPRPRPRAACQSFCALLLKFPCPERLPSVLLNKIPRLLMHQCVAVVFKASYQDLPSQSRVLHRQLPSRAPWNTKTVSIRVDAKIVTSSPRPNADSSTPTTAEETQDLRHKTSSSPSRNRRPSLFEPESKIAEPNV